MSETMLVIDKTVITYNQNIKSESVVLPMSLVAYKICEIEKEK